MPEISVIVPVYNTEKYLRRCVDSILAQSFTDFELILVDDGSSDNCGVICDEYAEKDSRVRVIHQENAKLSAARNAGLEIAQGEWIAFIDPDDWIHKDYLRLLLSAADKDTDVVVCGCMVTSSSDSNIDCLTKDLGFRFVSRSEIEKNRIARTRVWGRILKKEAIGTLRFISGTEPTEDSCFNELFFRSDMKFKMTDAKLYYYFMRPDSAIHNNMGRGTLPTVEQLLQHLPKIEDTKKRGRIISRCYKNVLHARYLEMLARDSRQIADQCKSLFRELKPWRKELSRKEQAVYTLFANVPFTYRLWRILDDPSLLKFEAEQRRRRRKGGLSSG